METTLRVASSVVIAISMLLIVVSGCTDDTTDKTTTLSPTRTPIPSDISTPVPLDTPVPSVTSTSEAIDTPTANGSDDIPSESESSLADLVEGIQPSVVQVIAGTSSGSGFIIDAEGTVITNEHVISGESNLVIRLTDGQRYRGDVLERDPITDIAWLKIDSNENFDAIALGDPNSVRVGDEVLALGFPLTVEIGTSPTVTRGIISSIRTVDGVKLLQTDAALNPGNSGGPLVNSAGEVVGVNTRRQEESIGGRPVSNIGFAVSVNEIERRVSITREDSSTKQNIAIPTAKPTKVPTWTATPVPTRTPKPTPSLVPTPTPTPVSPYVSVSSGGGNACGLRADGTAVCQGESDYNHLPPDERLTSISIGDTHICGLREDGIAVCWGHTDLVLVPGSLLEDENFKSISSGPRHNCGLNETEVVTPFYDIGFASSLVEVVYCWGSVSQSWALPTEDSRFLYISASTADTCAIREGGSLTCWGLSSAITHGIPPESDRFTSIAGGDFQTCGLRTDGTVVCWGEMASTPQDEELTAISTNGNHNTCGLRADGTAVCWGGTYSAPEDEVFTSVSSGSLHACGLREDSTILCWGHGLWNGFSPGDERFVSVSSGFEHSCGVREDGTIVCWGSLSWEETELVEDAPALGFGLGVDLSNARSSFEGLGFEFEPFDIPDGRPAIYGRKPPNLADTPEESIEIILVGDERGIEEAHLQFSHDTELLSPSILTFIQTMSKGQLTDVDWMVNDFIEGVIPSNRRIGEATVEATLLEDVILIVFKR